MKSVGSVYCTPDNKEDMERLVKSVYELDTKYADNKGMVLKTTQLSSEGRYRNIYASCLSPESQ